MRYMLVGIVLLAACSAAEARTFFDGLYSTMSYDTATGDTQGFELLIVPTGDDDGRATFTVFYQCAEGGFPDTLLLKATEKTPGHLLFEAPQGACGEGRYDAERRKGGLFLTLHMGRDISRLFLPRRRSHWQ